MLFNSYSFLFIFLPIILVIYYLVVIYLNAKYAIIFLGIASLFFYAYWSIESVPILLTSIFINFFIGIKLSNENLKNNKLVLIFGIAFNLVILIIFKYLNFIIDNLNLLLPHFSIQQVPTTSLLFPIGVSFFTFTQISFLMDAYYKGDKEKNFFKYFLFVSYFPHLIAGPIIHRKQLISQFESDRFSGFNLEKIKIGLIIFIIGLAKKTLIADQIGVYADLTFNGVAQGLIPNFTTAWFGALAYTFQLYFDFSGYSDMAVGISLLFGILLPINFNSPLKASSIIDFWQRWHISLTEYMGKYLYNPLALKLMRYGMGKNKFAEIIFGLFIPIIVTFLIIGFWHGASWNFILFGLLNGLLIVLNHIWRKFKPSWHWLKDSELGYLGGWFLTFASVCACFVVFRSDSVSSAMQIYRSMFPISSIFNIQWSDFVYSAENITLWPILLMAICFVIALFSPNSVSVLEGKTPAEGKTPSRKIPYLIFLVLIFILSVLQLGHTGPFLYFQF